MEATSFERQRNYFKCDNCRIRRRKCEPENRIWQPGNYQSCRPCAISRIRCGPNKFKTQTSLSTPPSSDPFTPGQSLGEDMQFHTFDESPIDPFLSGPANESFAALTPGFGMPADFEPSDGPLGDEHAQIRHPDITSEAAAAHDSPIAMKRQRSSARATTLKTKPVIRSNLEELGVLHDLLVAQLSRERAQGAAQPARQYQEFSDIGNSLATALFCTKNQFIQGCGQAYGRIIQSQANKELHLRRLFDKIGAFRAASSVVTRPSSDDRNIPSIDLRLLRLQCDVGASLVALYDDLEDHTEANHYRQEIRFADADANARTGRSPEDHLNCQDPRHLSDPATLTKRSLKISDAFNALNLRDLCGFITAEMKPHPPIHLAICSGMTATACELLSQNADMAKTADILKRQPAHWAAETGNLKLLDAFLQHGIPIQDPCQRDVYNMTPLCVAAYMGDLPIFQALHKAGYSLADQDITGRSVLTIACGAGCVEIVRYLLQQNVSPCEPFGLEKGQSYSALHAAAAGGHVEVVQLLQKHGASAVYVCNDRTPSQEAAQYGHEALAKMLQDAYEVEAKRVDRSTAGVLSHIQRAITSSRNSPDVPRPSPSRSCVASPQTSALSGYDSRLAFPPLASEYAELASPGGPRKRSLEEALAGPPHQPSSRPSSRASSRTIKSRTSPLRPQSSQ